MAQLPPVLYVCVLLAIACAVLLFATDTYGSIADIGTAPTRSRSESSRRMLGRDSTADQKATDQTLPQLSAFVGIMTATKPERRRVVRETWLPSDLQKCAQAASRGKATVRLLTCFISTNHRPSLQV